MILVIGYGNSMRSDDGAGIYVAQEIEKLGLPETEVRTLQQLSSDVLEDLDNYEKVILVDASNDGPEAELHGELVRFAPGPTASLSHCLLPEGLAGLAAQLYHSKTLFYVLTVPGERFDFGFQLSDAALSRARRAIEILKTIILTEATHA